MQVAATLKTAAMKVIDFHCEVVSRATGRRWQDAEVDAILCEASADTEVRQDAEYHASHLLIMRSYKLVVLAHFAAVVYARAQIEATLLNVAGHMHVKACLVPEEYVDNLATQIAKPRNDVRHEVRTGQSEISSK